MKKLLICVVAVMAAAFSSTSCYAGILDDAEQSYQHTRYDDALKTLEMDKHPSARTYAIYGRTYFMMGEFRKATESFEHAISLDPSRSEYFHWLGRAYGRRAETSSILTAPGFASKARQSFERAVALDAKNGEAINDLFDFYLEAPGFLGGGIDKATELAKRIGQLDPAEGHYAEAQIALHRKEMNTAEQQLRSAWELAPRQVGRVIDIAKFLARRGRLQESDAMFAKAAQIAPNDPKVLYERAALYVEQKRNLDVAQALLKQYLRSDLTPDNPSRSQAEKLLKRTEGQGL